MRVLFPAAAIAACFLALVASTTDGAPAAAYRVVDTIEIDTVPSWFPVGFSLLTHGTQQYVAYYDDEHRMMVAWRNLDEREWDKVELPSKIRWDSHNYVTMAVDAAGHLHLSGNMHGVPLIYFRTRAPGDPATFERLPMVGKDEKRCTYPVFFRDAQDNLSFMFRSGGSGNGRRFINRYDVATASWTRLLGGPLFEGEGKRNAYPLGPIRGPDGRFHVVWVWRDTPDCATNHHLSYARSRDLEHWEAADGTAAQLPMTLGQTALCVDPIPPGGGIINGCERLVFDSHQRPIISYHKSDAHGHMQIYVTRFEDGQWQRHPVTDWDKSIVFGGGGAMPFIGIRTSGLQSIENGMFYISYRHRDFGSGQIVLDEETLQPVARRVTIPREIPGELSKRTIAFEGIHVKLAHDQGEEVDANTKYVLRWETLGAHHDRPRQPPLPSASPLRLIKLVRGE